jgi:hypothetical protein
VCVPKFLFLFVYFFYVSVYMYVEMQTNNAASGFLFSSLFHMYVYIRSFYLVKES